MEHDGKSKNFTEEKRKASQWKVDDFHYLLSPSPKKMWRNSQIFVYFPTVTFYDATLDSRRC